MKTITFRGKQINYDDHPEFWEHLEGWEPETFDVLDRFIKPGSTFVDIGSWNGILTIYAGLMGATVYSVEPDPTAFKKLVNNVSMNNGDVTVCPYAIAGGVGKLPLRNSEGGFGNSMSSLLPRKEDLNGDHLLVDTVSLESFIVDYDIHPALIKIDTEGAETMIIPKAVNILKECNCPLLLSTHPQWYSDQAEEMKKILYHLSQVYDVSKAEFMIHDQILFLP